MLKSVSLLETIHDLLLNEDGWKSKRRVLDKVVSESLNRWINFAYRMDRKLRCLLFEWILQGKVWK